MTKPLSSLIFQVRSNSELGQALQAIAEGSKTDQELEAVTGFKRTGALLRQFGQNFDNLTVNYTNSHNGVKIVSLNHQSTATQLRVRPGSELDRMVRAIQEHGPQTGQQLVKLTGVKRSPWFLRTVGQNFDNFKVFWVQGQDTHDVEYIDLAAQTVVVNVDQAQFTGGAEASQPQQPQDLSLAGQLVWPDAPPLLDTHDYFRKPNWYGEMEAMVDAGCHISLEGPPSVGKDTAIKNLAAEKGVPLVSKLGSGLRKRDLTGTAQMVNGTTVFLVDEFAAAVVNGWWAVITEVNAAEPDVTVFLNGILDEPFVINLQGKQYPVHPDFRLFIDYNHGLHGVKPLNQAFKDRFHPVKLQFLTETELRERLVAHGMPRVEELGTVLVNGEREVSREVWPEVVVKYGLAMAQRYESGRTRYHITVRRLLGVVTLMNRGVYTDIKKAIRSAVINGIDSEQDSREAEQVLRDVCGSFGI